MLHRTQAMLALLALLLFVPPAHATRAADVTVASEYHRLASELGKLARRQVWSGVERTYRSMLSLNTPLGADDHLHAAQAARVRGDVAAQRERLLAAVALREDRDAIETLYQIDHHLGRVDLTGDAELAPETAPFLPDHAAAVAHARAQLAEHGRFTGYLPPGVYRYGALRIVVVPAQALVRVQPPGDGPDDAR